jgi:bifunctional polynucleotide phosphatase/kinase
MDKKRKMPSQRISWSIHDSCLMGEWRDITPLLRIAAFDFDGTLCGNLGNYVYPKHKDDWRWVHPIIPQVLASLYNFGYQIIILSNQKGILSDDSKSIKRKNIFQSRVFHILEALEFETGIEIPVRILAASSDDLYRKPRKGMWKIVVEKWTDQTSVLQDCFYCGILLYFIPGDAAGRMAEWIKGYKKQGTYSLDWLDFADTDHKFALNLNMRFFVPEQIFHNNVITKAIIVNRHW